MQSVENISNNTTHPLVYASASSLVQRIKFREISVVQLVTAFLEQIRRYNPVLNAIFDLRSETEILAEAQEKDNLLASGKATGALFGLPMTIKDNFMVKGLKTSNGNPLFRKYIADTDAELVKRLKDAGVIILGKTNVPLLSIDWQSTNFWNGQTNNPYDQGRVAGGSSGGAAVAVAAGLSALELGGDAGGSIRVPAHFNGICGLRPTEQALPNRGHIRQPGKPQGLRNLTVAGPLAKTVDDLILAMQVLWNNKNYPLAEIPAVDFEATGWGGEPLRIAVAESMNEVEIDAEYLEIFRHFIGTIENYGHSITHDYPRYDEAKAYLTCGKLFGFEFDINMPHVPLARTFIYWFIRLKYRDKLWAKGIKLGIYGGARRYAQTLDEQDAVADIYTGFLIRYDIWITPVCALEAFPHQQAGKPFVINGKTVPYTKAIAAYTFTTALSGHPIVVIPIGQKKNGLPVGIQIHARKWNDKRVLEIARYFEGLITKIPGPVL